MVRAGVSVVVGLMMVRVCFAAGVDDINEAYHFKLVEGKGKDVCDAYLERLNAVDYNKLPGSPLSQPFCDRPESDTVAGFTKLNRVPLTLEERNRLLVNVYNFTHPDSMVPDSRVKDFFDWSLDRIGQPIWRYDPPVDINNDGVLEDVIVWRGWGAEAGDNLCGVPYAASRGLAWRTVQQAYILNADGTSVDKDGTKAVFWRRKSSGRGAEPYGQEIGIFEFRGYYYFDAFHFGPAPFDAGQSTPAIADTLGVFLHKDGATRQICAYRMRDPESPTDRRMGQNHSN